MTKQEAQAVLNTLNNFLDDRLNLMFDKHHKNAAMNEMNMLLSGMIPQPQPQPDIKEPKKVKGVEITPKGLKQNENKE